MPTQKAIERVKSLLIGRGLTHEDADIIAPYPERFFCASYGEEMQQKTWQVFLYPDAYAEAYQECVLYGEYDTYSAALIAGYRSGRTFFLS